MRIQPAQAARRAGWALGQAAYLLGFWGESTACNLARGARRVWNGAAAPVFRLSFGIGTTQYSQAGGHGLGTNGRLLYGAGQIAGCPRPMSATRKWVPYINIAAAPPSTRRHGSGARHGAPTRKAHRA